MGKPGDRLCIDARREDFLAPLPVGCATRKIIYLTKQIKIFLVAHPTGSGAHERAVGCRPTAGIFLAGIQSVRKQRVPFRAREKAPFVSGRTGEGTAHTTFPFSFFKEGTTKGAPENRTSPAQYEHSTAAVTTSVLREVITAYANS